MLELVNLSKKVLLLGDPSVGKTSLIRKFVYDIFNDNYISTLGAKVSRKGLIFNYPAKDLKIDIKLMIWDVMGQKEYAMLHRSAYLGSQGALIICDITRKETLDNISNWITELFNVVGQIPLVAIGNKYDLIGQKQFEIQDLEKLVKTFNAPTLQASAKTGENVEFAFKTLSENMVRVDFGG
jgi:small GTP-binding protein